MRFKIFHKIALCFISLLIIALCSTSFGASITLQQGVDGYTGCNDSYICHGGYGWFTTGNFGDSGTLHFRNEQYQLG